MEKSLVFLLFLLLHSCLERDQSKPPKLIKIKNIKPLEVFVKNKMILTKTEIDSEKNFTPIIINGGEGGIDIEVIDGPGKITSTDRHKYVFKNNHSGESIIKISDDIGQIVKRVITTETPYQISLSKKFISRNPGEKNQVLIKTVGGQGKSMISLGEGSLGNIVNNKLYIPPTIPSKSKERIEIIAEDENGNKAFETITLFPPFRVESDKMELTANSPFSESNKVRIKVFGGVNILNNNSGIKINFKKGQSLLFKKTSENEIVFYPPRKKTHKISNIVISDDIGNKQHLKILINDQMSAQVSQVNKESDLLEVDLLINGGSGKIKLEKEITNSASVPNLHIIKQGHYTINNQVDGSAILNFKDENEAVLKINVIVRDSLIYLKQVDKHYEKKNFIFYLFKKDSENIKMNHKNLKIRKIGHNRYSAFPVTSGNASLRILDDTNKNEINEEFTISSQPLFKAVDPIDFLDSYEPDVFEQIGENRTGYTKFKLTDFSCGLSVGLEFPENYFSDEAISCDTNQIELKRKYPYYSIRSPSSINFNQHRHSQIINLHSETQGYSLESSSAYLIKKNPLNIQQSIKWLDKKINSDNVNMFTKKGGHLLMTKRKRKLCLFDLSNPNKREKCFIEDLRYLSNDSTYIYFLQIKANQFILKRADKDKFWEEDLIDIKTFDGPSENYVLTNVFHQNDNLIFQIITNNHKSDSSLKLENITIHMNLKHNKVERFSSTSYPLKETSYFENESFYFLSKKLGKSSKCVTRLNFLNGKEDTLYCSETLEAFFFMEKDKFLLLEKEYNFWFNQDNERIVYRDYQINLNLLEMGAKNTLNSISPDRSFYEARCGKEIDANSFKFFKIGKAIYVIFNQKGHLISHNFMPIHNNDQNTVGILRIDLEEKNNLLYRQLSGPFKEELNSNFGNSGSHIIGVSKRNNQIQISALHDKKEILNYTLEELVDENFQD